MTGPARIVVGVDGSPGGETALRWAVEEATRRRLPLRVVHAVSPVKGPPMLDTAVLASVDWEALGHELVGQAADLARRLAPGLTVDTRVYLDESTARALARRRDPSDLLVLGSRGRNAIAELLLGSTTLKTVELAAGPVVVVREPGPDVMPGPDAGRVVVGVDGSELSAAAVRFAFAHASTHGSGLTVLHAWTKPPVSIPSVELAYPHLDWSFLEREGAALLANALDPARREHPEVAVTERLVEDQPGKALVEASRGARLVVVGSRGRGGFAGLVLGSVSHAVIHHAHAPVAVIRPAS